MRLAAHGHLREVRHDDHLVRAREVGQHVGQGDGGRAAHAGVHLVEHERVHLVNLAEHHLHRQHDAADLAARRDARKRARPHPGSGAKQELHRLRPRLRPLAALERRKVAHELRAAHFQAAHLRAHGFGEARRGLGARFSQHGRRLRKRLLGLIELLPRRALALGGVVHERHELGRLRTAFEHVGHARAVRAHKPLQRSHALLLPGKRLRVELHALAIVTRLARHVLQHVARLAQRFGELAELRIVARRAVERRDGAAERVERTLLARKRLVRGVRRDRERFGVLHARQLGCQLVVLALARIHRVDALQHEARLVELGRGCLARLAHPRQLGRGRVGRRERVLVDGARPRHRLARPRVEHAHVPGRLHKLLVLVLAAQIDGGRHGARKLSDAGHAAVEGHARAPIGRHAADGHDLPEVAKAALSRRGIGFGILGGGDAVEPSRHRQRLLAVADCPLVGALAHEQLQRREQRGLARARLAREHREAARRLERGLTDQGEVLNLDLVDHRAPLHASPNLNCSV